MEARSPQARGGLTMVFRRGARRSWYFTGRTRTGWEQLCTFSPDRKTAAKIEAMWAELAEDHRAFDVLDRVLSGELTAAALYDLWRDREKVDRNVTKLRQHLADTDLEPLVEEFLDIYGRKYPGAVGHVRSHLRWLMPEGVPLLASTATGDYLTGRLYAYEGKRNTLRKVHADWSVFFAYCVKPKRLFQVTPMIEVERPPAEKTPVAFYELDVIERIVAWQPTPERRALFALLYGGAIESTVALGVPRSDVNPSTQEVRAPGTKAHTRDRVCRIDSWAWPHLWSHARTILPTARLFPAEWTRHQVHDWHTEAVEGLELTRTLKPYASRHAWAARWLRAGTPVEVVQKQLGHASPMLTLSLYGQFLPSSVDRAAWEAKVSANEQTRREANK